MHDPSMDMDYLIQIQKLNPNIRENSATPNNQNSRARIYIPERVVQWTMAKETLQKKRESVLQISCMYTPQVSHGT